MKSHILFLQLFNQLIDVLFMAPVYQYIVNIYYHYQHFVHEETRIIFGWADTKLE